MFQMTTRSLIPRSCIGLREVLAESPAIVVPPRDAAALATALAGEINHPTRDAFEQYAETARKRYAIERPSTELHKLYRKVLG